MFTEHQKNFLISLLAEKLNLNHQELIYYNIPDVKREIENEIRIINSIMKSPENKINELRKRYSNIITLYKIMLFATPIYLILIPYLIYIYRPQEFFHVVTIFIIMYVFIIESYFFRLSIINKIKFSNDLITLLK